MAGKQADNSTIATSTDTATAEAAWATVRPYHPGDRLERAWTEGRQASQDGQLIGANPHTYDTNSPEYAAWSRGWVQHAGSATSWSGSKWQSAVPDK